MAKEKLFLNTLTFDYPSEPVRFYFSPNDDAERRSTRLKSPVLVPKEVKQTQKYIDLFAGGGGFKELFTTFEQKAAGFDAIDVDFNEPENENLVKRYYNRQLEKYFRYYEDIVITNDGITRDLQIWILNKQKRSMVQYNGKALEVMQLDRFTLKVRFDSFNRKPYLLVAQDKPAQLLNISLQKIFDEAPKDPFEEAGSVIMPSMINKVMTREEKEGENGHKYVVRKIDRYDFLQQHNMYCPLGTTRPILGGELKKFLGLSRDNDEHDYDDYESKYVRYFDQIEWFRKKYLNTEGIAKIFHNLAYKFTSVNELQLGQISSTKRTLVFGKTPEGEVYKNARQQSGVNYGPHIKCPHTDVRLIFIFPSSSKSEARKLLQDMKNGGYQNQSKKLSHYIGSPVSYAPKSFHIEFKDENNPVPEIEKALQQDCYRERDNRVKYMGIYISPIHKYASSRQTKECYYKVKELFLRYDIPTQCIDRDKMNMSIARDNQHHKANFVYTLQNMGVAICAKLGGSPWLLDETAKKELIIGIGAFKSDNQQYIGAAFSFDNTGVFNDYSYFQKSEMDELVGAIRMAIIKFATINQQPERIIIHYYKKMSRKKEFLKIERMLDSLDLKVPVYVVTINKTESEDIVMFDGESTYTQRDWTTRTDITKQSLMPFSGRWVNLGATTTGHTYLLCNNTRYENGRFSPMDGFPFPVKLNIACPNRKEEMETPVVKQLIEQVYQFSRIYWKSVKQQGLPVTIKYPEMIAEIMPHFEDKTVYIENNCLWFL